LEVKLFFKNSFLFYLFILDNQYQTFRIDFPSLEGVFTGTGDSFSALILAWFHKENNLIVS
jgi:pyridoxal/pyridoxine/pyridoxamine kinase